MTSLTLSGPAQAQPRDAARIQTGEDLAVWRDLQRDAPDDVDALVDFLEAYPSSPLAELAYRRLVEVEADLPADFRGNTARVSTSYHRHQEALSRTPAGVAVAKLEVTTAEVVTTPVLRERLDRAVPTLHVETGLGWATMPTFYAGLGGQIGAVSLTARGMFDQDQVALGAALRYDPWRYWLVSPFVETALMGPDVMMSLSLGGSYALPQGFALEAAVGGQTYFAEQDRELLLRVGISQSF